MSVRVAIISAAHMHAVSYVQALQGLNGLAVAAGVYDDNSDRGRAFAARYGVRWIGDPQALMAQCDAVIVTSANAHHRVWAEMALRAGKPVLCEKPLATSVEDGAYLVEMSRRLSVPLFVALPVRFVPTALDLRHLVQRGEIGRLLALVGTNHGVNPQGWFADPVLAGGGAVADHTAHIADLMRWITETEVAVVYAEVSDAMSQAGVDDCAILTLQFQNGVVATLDPSWSRLAGHPAPVDVTLEAVGTMGVAHWDAFADHVNFWRGHTPYTIPVSESMDVRLIRAFVQAVTVGKASSLLATGVDGLRGVEIMVAAYQSAALRKPVAIGPVPF